MHISLLPAIQILFSDGVALVVKFFALCQGDFHFDQRPYEIDFERHDGRLRFGNLEQSEHSDEAFDVNLDYFDVADVGCQFVWNECTEFS